ncbi:hypothetical protein ACHAWF_017545, partial [Thalassiosira exigua]
NALGIEPKQVVTQYHVSGWEDKCKGLLQILWERGFVDEGKIGMYKLRSEDEDEILIKYYCLQHLIKTCNDFVNEVTQLEHALITSKYHAEYAGGGGRVLLGLFKAVLSTASFVIEEG